ARRPGGGGGRGRRRGGQAALPGVEGGQGDTFLGTERGGAEAGLGEAREALGPGGAGTAAGSGLVGRGSRSGDGFGHEKPPKKRATPGGYSTRQGRDPPGAYREAREFFVRLGEQGGLAPEVVTAALAEIDAAEAKFQAKLPPEVDHLVNAPWPR